MKKLILILISLFFTVMLQAQVFKTVNVTIGGLSSALTNGEYSSVTNLTITGTLNASDFQTVQSSEKTNPILF